MFTSTTRLLITAVACTLATLATAQAEPTSLSLAWSRLSPANSPSARSGPAMAFDRAGLKVVLFGGLGANGYRNDTYTFDGATWTKQNTAVQPPARTGASMAFDTVTRKLVLFGGYNGSSYLGDTWLWDGTTSTWTQASPTTSPKAVTGPMVFTDPLNGRVDVMGGYDGSRYQSSMWRWTGTDWRQLNPAHVPGARSAAVVATDTREKYTLVFDGLADINPYNTWTWDGMDWTEQFPAAQPPSLYSAGAAFFPLLQGVVVFGGGHGGQDVNDTWGWSGTNWFQIFPGHAPGPREGMGIVYYSGLHGVVIFGGQNSTNLFNDTWLLALTK